MVSALCPVWCSWVLCKCRNNVFNLLHELTRSPHWGVMHIFGWELLMLCHHPGKFGDHKHCVAWPYKITSLKSHANFWWELLMLFHHHDKFGDHKHCVTWPCNTISLRSHANFWVKPLVVYHQPDKFDDHKHCVTWPYQTTSLWSHTNYWVGAPCGMSPPWQVWWPLALW